MVKYNFVVATFILLDVIVQSARINSSIIIANNIWYPNEEPKLPISSSTSEAPDLPVSSSTITETTDETTTRPIHETTLEFYNSDEQLRTGKKATPFINQVNAIIQAGNQNKPELRKYLIFRLDCDIKKITRNLYRAKKQIQVKMDSCGGNLNVKGDYRSFFSNNSSCCPCCPGNGCYYDIKPTTPNSSSDDNTYVPPTSIPNGWYFTTETPTTPPPSTTVGYDYSTTPVNYLNVPPTSNHDGGCYLPTVPPLSNPACGCCFPTDTASSDGGPDFNFSINPETFNIDQDYVIFENILKVTKVIYLTLGKGQCKIKEATEDISFETYESCDDEDPEDVDTLDDLIDDCDVTFWFSQLSNVYSFFG